MPELRRVETADLSPGVCVFCRAHEGPFVEVVANMIDVPVTAVEGLSDFPDGQARTTLSGAFYVCVGRDDTDNGCARQIAALADCLNPQQVTGLHAHVGAYRDKVIELEQQLSDEQAKPRVVELDELLALIRQETKPATVESPVTPA